MVLTSADGLYQVFPRGGGLFDNEALRGLLKASIAQGSMLPCIGLILLGADRFTSSSHTYKATMVPVPTADVPTPADVFRDRDAVLVLRSYDDAPVVAVEWQSGDLDTVGTYRLQFTATEVADPTQVEVFPVIEVTVVEKL